MEFNNIDHHFCEGNILGVPEVLNSFTSLIFSFFGIYGLFNKNREKLYIINNNQFIIDLVYSIFVTIGIGSFGYHWTQYIGWALMDELPMIVSIFIGLLYIEYCNFLLNNIHDNNNNNNNLNYKITIIFLTFIMFYFITINPINYYRKLFPIVFGCVLILFSYKFINLINNFDKKFNKNILLYGNQQLIIICIAGLIWSFTETICKYNNNLFLLLGHPLWHFFMAYGFYNIIQIIYYISLYTSINYIQNYQTNILDIYLYYNKLYILTIQNNILDN
jgi:hypothetical protein